MKNCLILVLLLIFTKVNAQEVSYANINYGVEQGLPTSEIYNVTKDCNDYIWFGTDAGISKFDGYSFKNFTSEDGLTDHTIFNLYEDRFKRMWFLPFNNKLGYIKNDSVYAYQYNTELKTSIENGVWIHKIRIDSSDNLSFLLTDGSLGSVDSLGRVKIDNENTYGPSILTYTINDNEHMFTIKRNHNENALNCLLIDNISKDETYFDFKVSNHIMEKTIGYDSFFFSNSLKIGYKNGSSLSFISFPFRVLGFTLAKNGNLWVQIQNKGIYVFESPEKFMEGDNRLYSLFGNKTVTSVLHSNKGEVWICTEKRGVHYIRNEFIKLYTYNKEIKNRLSALCVNNNHEIFYANRDGEVYKFNSNGEHTKILTGAGEITHLQINKKQELTLSSFDSRPIANPIANIPTPIVFNARTFIKTKNNETWKIISNGIQKTKDGELLFDSQLIMGDMFFHTVFEDKDGQIWVGGNQGLFLFSNNELVPFKNLFKQDVKIKCIRALNNGTIITATASNGLYFITKKNGQYIVQNIKLDGVTIKDFHVDEQQKIWLATNQGLVILSKTIANTIFIRSISHIHGLPSGGINSVLTDNNTVYLATNKGLVVFDQSILAKNKEKIKLSINEIKVNERSLKTDTTYRFKSTDNFFEFSFTGLAYKNPKGTTYGYKLEGVDTKWQYTTTRKVRYPSLLPNDYVFRVKVENEDGIWSDSQNFAFTICPPFWKENKFLLLCSLVLSMILFLIHKKVQTSRKNKVLNMKELEQHKRKRIEAELRALRSQMNPHFTFNTLNSIQFFITNFNQKKANKYISDFSLLLRKVLENSRYTTITIAEEIKMLTLYLNLENLRFDDSIQYEFIIDSKLDTSFQEIPSMIIQPFVENAVIHGLSGKKEGEKKLTIEILQKENHLVCIVQDSGIGRKKATINQQKKRLNHESLGMKITNERLQLFNKEKGINLTFEIIDLYDKNNIGCGTRIEIYLKNS